MAGSKKRPRGSGEGIKKRVTGPLRKDLTKIFAAGLRSPEIRGLFDAPGSGKGATK